MSAATKEIANGSPDFFTIKLMDHGRFLVISLGPGAPKSKAEHNATKVAKWGLLQWLPSGGSTPIIYACTHATADVVDLHLLPLSKPFTQKKSYLQDDTLSGVVSSVTKKNLDDLVKVGELLLKKPVLRVHVEAGVFEPLGSVETNEDALIRFAMLSSEERRTRNAKSPHGKKGN